MTPPLTFTGPVKDEVLLAPSEKVPVPV